MKLKLALVPFVGAALALPLLITPQVALAQTKAKTATKLPSAEKVMDGYFATLGSKAALNAIKSAIVRGKFAVPAQNINGTFEMQTKSPNKIYSKQEIPGIGTMEQGFDGNVGWSRDPINGLRTLGGGELKQLKSQSDDIKGTDWRSLYSKAEMLGIRKVGTADAYAIRLTPKTGGKPTVAYIDVKSKLQVRTDLVVESMQGSLPVQNFSSDFRTVSGVKMPFKQRQVIGPTEATQTIEVVKFNTPVDDAIFAKPKAPAPKTVTPKP